MADQHAFDGVFSVITDKGFAIVEFDVLAQGEGVRLAARGGLPFGCQKWCQVRQAFAFVANQAFVHVLNRLARGCVVCLGGIVSRRITDLH